MSGSGSVREVAVALRAGVEIGVLRSGEHLWVGLLAALHGVPQKTVRRALVRLGREGLVMHVCEGQWVVCSAEVRAQVRGGLVRLWFRAWGDSFSRMGFAEWVVYPVVAVKVVGAVLLAAALVVGLVEAVARV